jgi:SpoIID/LytB domain protein
VKLLQWIATEMPQYDWYSYVMVGVCLCGLTMAVARDLPTEPELNIGIVQRFGANQPAEIDGGTSPAQVHQGSIVSAPSGDKLTLKFTRNDRQTEQLVTDRVQLNVKVIDTPPRLEERLVVGDYRNFENAENAAQALTEQGIKVEIAQPHRWQVWAHRQIYHTAATRRKLLAKLQQLGTRSAYLDARLSEQATHLRWIVKGREYVGKNLEIIPSQRRLRIQSPHPGARLLTYPGKLRIQPNAYGSYTIVNQVPLETYLRGVVPNEIAPGAPYQANAAQAIIARTYVLRNLRRFAIDDYHLCADTQCQVYRGLANTNEVADRAILDTRGRVLTCGDRPIDALYSSTNGGITAQFGEIWDGNNRPYLANRVDANQPIWDLARHPLQKEANLRQFINLKHDFNESKWGVFRWRKDSSLGEIVDFLNIYLDRTHHPIGKIDEIDKITIVERGASGRATKVVIVSNKGVIELTKDDIRSAFQAPRSTLFYLEPIDDPAGILIGYWFVGGGLGHGVGLSQTGAYSLAQQGKTAADILRFYYPDTQLQEIVRSMYE